MILLDSNIFIVDRFFPRDALYPQNRLLVQHLEPQGFSSAHPPPGSDTDRLSERTIKPSSTSDNSLIAQLFNLGLVIAQPGSQHLARMLAK